MFTYNSALLIDIYISWFIIFVKGAKNIAVELEKFFTDNNEKLDFMLDEGMFVMKDVFPGNNFIQKMIFNRSNFLTI